MTMMMTMTVNLQISFEMDLVKVGWMVLHGT